ncbi:hypothetical protein SAMN05216548_101397 [Faunimonas pinastri]|uniref:Glutamine amidotransferase domain-containing protein n=1 Tax=Faunimonas pinastri TaxID=1855383 RepID=A0A1H9AFE1_9HYPH|nr:hypothetical protein [Faunimonas pinastri]SEP74668.1 hypothetical protein SAMN05216548_101397 [Faunimonas pinastri]
MNGYSLSFEPVLPWPVIAVLAVLLAVVTALLFWRRMRGAWLRGLACALLVLALTNPVAQREQRDMLPGVVALVVDDSGSQTLGNRTKQTQDAVAGIKQRIAALGGFNLREIHVGDSQSGGGTQLFSALTRSLDDVPPEQISGAIFVTDGQVHDIPANAGQLGFRAPVHALVTGERTDKDRRIVLRRAPRFAILGEPQSIDYTVLDSALPDGTPLTVKMRVDGVEVATDRAEVGEVRTIDLPLRHAGHTIVELEVEPEAGELTAQNNVAVAEMDVVREHLRVLLVSGEPHAGERTWRNALKSDAAVDLVHFTILRPPEKQDGTPINELSLIAFPTRELFDQKIDQFDLIVFDRYEQRGVLPVSYYDNIANYVRQGGAVLVASGPEYAGEGSLYNSPLGSVLPAVPTGETTEQPFYPMVSDIGRRHPVTRDLPGSDTNPPKWSHWFRLIDSEATGGQTVMTGPNDLPLLQLAHEGEGRAAMLLSDHEWLWARGFEGGGPHAALLRRVLHWLMKEPDLEEEALRARADGRTLIVERQTLSDTAPTVKVTDPSGKPEAVTLKQAEPGLWRGTIPNAPLGLHRAEDGSLTALAHVGPANPIEFQDVLSDTAKLGPIANATGGSVSRVSEDGRLTLPRISTVSADAPAAGSGWIGLRRSAASVLKGVDRLPLFSGLLGLAILLGAFAALWFRESR